MDEFHVGTNAPGSGPDLTDARPQADPFVRPPLPLLRGQNRKALINLCKVVNDDIDVENLRSIKNSKSLLECPTITVLKFLLSTQKPSMTRNSWYRACWPAGTGYFIFASKPTEKGKCLTIHMAYVFYKFHICFFLSVLRKIKHTAHMCGGMKTIWGPHCDLPRP